MSSYLGLDDKVSHALRLPRAPLSEDDLANIKRSGRTIPKAPHGYRG